MLILIRYGNHLTYMNFTMLLRHKRALKFASMGSHPGLGDSVETPRARVAVGLPNNAQRAQEHSR
jgi:hypothetical protein